jgi:hypothetical protein
MIVLIKSLHTAVWTFMVACIVAIYVFASSAQFGLTLLMIAIVLGEVLILALNRMSCPLTPIAARYTADRRPNFDIYLPQWLAKRNKEIFGALYVGGVLYALAMWLRAA